MKRAKRREKRAGEGRRGRKAEGGKQKAESRRRRAVKGRPQTAREQDVKVRARRLFTE
jgi:hypothetical protein